ncbi:MAG: RraA family protein [Burkholderiales bacterium]|nr:RraA family protein [Burkholderiales bacterium]
MTIGFRILPSPALPAQELLDALRPLASANLSDSMNFTHAVSGAIRAMHRGGVLCGPALTVRVPPNDNLMVHKAVDVARAGEVIVVEAGGSLDVSVVGGIVTAYAASRGIAGFVIDGAIRDLAEIGAGALPVYARGTSPRGPRKEGPGEINVAIDIGGVVVQAGDLVVGDQDGVVIVPRAEAEGVIQRTLALAQREQDVMQRIAQRTLDRSWVDQTLKAKGCSL